MSGTPAWRIETERLWLRPYQEADAESLRQSILESLDHLRAWLPWAMAEPETVEAKRERIRNGRAAFRAGGRRSYGLFDRGGGDAPGSAFLGIASHEPCEGARERELGYWLHRGAEGRGLMAEAVAAMAHCAYALEGVRSLEIQCDPENRRSTELARRLGFRHVATWPRHKHTPAGARRDTGVWVHERDGDPAFVPPVAAFDEEDRRLL